MKNKTIKLDKSYKKIKVISIIILMLITLCTLKNFNNKKIIEAKKTDFKSENYITDISATINPPSVSQDGISDDSQVWDIFKTPLSFIVSILWWIIKAILFLAISAFLNIIGVILATGGGSTQVLNIESILFNEIPILNPAFWQKPYKAIDGFYDTSSGAIVEIIKFAIIIQLFVLLIISIKSIIRTVKLKQYAVKDGTSDVGATFKNWIMGLVIVFGIIFYAAIIIGINNKIVEILRDTIKAQMGDDITDAVSKDIFSLNIMKSTVAFLIYIMIKIQAIALFIKYISRWVKITFLILISPLIASTYAIDRIGDGKSQALSTWNKMFVQTVFMQIIHVIIYTTSISVLLNPGNDSISIAGLIISILGVNFIWTAEKIIYNIFGMDSGEMGSLLGSTRFAQSVVMSKHMKDTASKVIGASKKGAGKVADKVSNTKLGKAVKEKNIKNKEKIGKFKDKVFDNKFAKNVKSLKDDANIKKDKLIKDIQLAPIKTAQSIKEKAYKKVGLKAPTKEYAERLNAKKISIETKKAEKIKRKKEKKATRKKRAISKAVTFGASVGSLAVATSTRQLELSDFGQSYLRGKVINKALEENMQDKTPKPKKLEKEKPTVEDVKKQQDYEKMFNEYKRPGDKVLKETDLNSEKYKIKEKEAMENMLINAKVKEKLSGKSFDIETKEGRDNFEKYNEAFNMLESRETASILDKKVEENKNELKKYLGENLKKTSEEIDVLLKQIESLVKNGIPIETNKENAPMNNYISSLVDKRYFIDKEQFEASTQKINKTFTNDIFKKYIENHEEYTKEKEEAEKEIKKIGLNIDEYYDM